MRKKIPVPQERLPAQVPTQEIPAPRRGKIPSMIAEVVDRVREEMPGAETTEITAELVNRLETAIPGVTFNHDALRAHAENIHCQEGARPDR